MSLYPRSEQFDRIHHFLMNITNNKFYQNQNEEQAEEGSSPVDVNLENNIEGAKEVSHPYVKFYHGSDTKVTFKVKIIDAADLELEQINKIRFFHVFMFNVIYSSESSFYKGIFNGDWDFGEILNSTLKKIRVDIIRSKIFTNTQYYESQKFMDESLYMFSIPIKDDKVDWSTIESCIRYVKLRLLTFTKFAELLKLRAFENPLYPCMNPAIEIPYERKERCIKFTVYDVVTNGGKYFYKNLRPMSDLKESFSRASNKPKEDNEIRRKKQKMNFIEFYKHQYAYAPEKFEDLYSLNKLTTPKENVKKAKNHKKERKELSQFDFPTSLMSPNPLGIHYFELFGLSVAMYTKLKEEFRTIEFINKYLANMYIEKQKNLKKYKHNHFLFDDNPVEALSDKEVVQQPKVEREVKLDKESATVPLSEIFLTDDNYEIILQSLTCSTAEREHNYELYEFLGDAVIALLLRFESVIFNQKIREDGLDIIRLETESNMRFCEINKKYKFYNYMIGSSDISTKTFIPPLFNKTEFEKILSLKKNEMSNKMLFFRAMYESYKPEVREMVDLLYGEDVLPPEDVDKEAIDKRTFTLKRERRCTSQTYRKEINYETIKERLYRKTTHCSNNIESLKHGFTKEESVNILNIFTKEFRVKQFADVIESLAAAMYLGCGLHGAQVFLKSIRVLDNTKDYVNQFKSLIEELDTQLIDDYNNRRDIRNVENILGYKFNYKKLLLIALTHKSYNNSVKENRSFFTSYENLEFLGDAVHKFFVVKRLKEKFEKESNSLDKEPIPTEDIIDSLNKKKTAAETNELLGFICIHTDIYKAIMHTTPNTNHIEKYAKLVKKREKELRDQSDDIGARELVKLDLNFTQYHVKMLADVMEALIGAIFLD